MSQLSVVKSRVLIETEPSVVSLLFTGIDTPLIGSESSFTVKKAFPPFSVVTCPESGLTVIPVGAQSGGKPLSLMSQPISLSIPRDKSRVLVSGSA